MGRLKPNGYLVFTTRGHKFIDNLEPLQRDSNSQDGTLREPRTRLQWQLPAARELRRRHLQGEFQFYPIGTAGQLTSDFFGEALIPRSYIERAYGSSLVDFSENVPDVDQSIVILQKNRSW